MSRNLQQKSSLAGLLPEDSGVPGLSPAQQAEQLTAKIQVLRRDNVLLLTQLARAAKCLNAVASENALLKSEVASLGPGGGQGMQR